MTGILKKLRFKDKKTSEKTILGSFKYYILFITTAIVMAAIHIYFNGFMAIWAKNFFSLI
ncbi:hypothetical protein SDC9_208119 [bioreactor metagenome]|uniref:Uncharacterized protein n=1 Tax=bioreactor metagenome TaxID=1076179 RepID=A0A645J9U4_9ZZZZ